MTARLQGARTHLFDWCTARKITFTRGRPSNKNDGCHVEQKNWTHVRELVGYLRFDTDAELGVLNLLGELAYNSAIASPTAMGSPIFGRVTVVSEATILDSAHILEAAMPHRRAGLGRRIEAPRAGGVSNSPFGRPASAVGRARNDRQVRDERSECPVQSGEPRS